MNAPSEDARRSWLDRLDDRLNPVLFKEIGQAVRARYFAVSFALMLVLALVIVGTALVVWAGELRDPNVAWQQRASTQGLFLGITALLCFTTLVVTPAAAYRGMEQEQLSHTYDLLIITAMSPGAIVRGKIMATLVQIALFFSALAPFMAVIYMVGDIGLPTAGLVLLTVFAAATVLSAGSLGAAAVFRTRRNPALFSLLNTVGLFVAASIVFTFCVAMVEEDVGAGAATKEFWVNFGAVATAVVFATAFGYVLALQALTFPSANRTTATRLLTFAAWLTFTLWVFYYWRLDGGTHPEYWSVYGTTAMVVLAFMALWATADRDDLSRRVAVGYPRSLPGRAFAAFFYPGNARGVLFVGLLMLLTAAATYAGYWASSPDLFQDLVAFMDGNLPISGTRMMDDLIGLLLPVLVAGYVCLYIFAPLPLLRLGVRAERRAAVIVAVLATFNLLPVFARLFMATSSSSTRIQDAPLWIDVWSLPMMLVRIMDWRPRAMSNDVVIAGLGMATAGILLAVVFNVVPCWRAAFFRRPPAAAPPPEGSLPEGSLPEGSPPEGSPPEEPTDGGSSKETPLPLGEGQG